jgi:hypothetical protein
VSTLIFLKIVWSDLLGKWSYTPRGEVETGQVKTDCPNMDFTLPGVLWEIAYR